MHPVHIHAITPTQEWQCCRDDHRAGGGVDIFVGIAILMKLNSENNTGCTHNGTAFPHNFVVIQCGICSDVLITRAHPCCLHLTGAR